DREALEIRAAADAREISSRNAGTGLCFAYAQLLRIEHSADLRRKRALELLRVRACIFHRSLTGTPFRRRSVIPCCRAYWRPLEARRSRSARSENTGIGPKAQVIESEWGEMAESRIIRSTGVLRDPGQPGHLTKEEPG